MHCLSVDIYGSAKLNRGLKGKYIFDGLATDLSVINDDALRSAGKLTLHAAGSIQSGGQAPQLPRA
jgi:hypothetical protein